MWCIVNLPNCTQQAVKWDPKAIGQECLEKVCKALGIICEMEYFGLEHWTPCQKESRTHQWINLRNRLSCDSSTGSGSGIQLMLALRVKFWVPVHFILQESARNLFYMQAKVDLLEGRLNARNWSEAAKLAALMCQADGLRFNEAALKAECPLKIQRQQELLRQQQLLQQQQQQANKERKDKEHVLSFKKRRLSKQKSVENMHDHVPACHQQSPVCSTSTSSCSSIVGSNLATNINTTNTTKPAPTPTSPTPPPPHTSSTNELQQTKVPSLETKSTCDTQQQLHDEESIEQSIRTSPLRMYLDYILRPANDGELPEDFLRQIAVEHGKLAILNMSQKSAKYWLLQEIQELPGYGEEVFSGVTTVAENSQRCEIAVGAHGIKVSIGDNEKNIPFSAIAAAKSFRRTFKLEYVDDHNERREVDMKLPRHCIAAGLYRSITERHAFYVCDKVRGVVTNQFTRDLKGTIASMFKEDTELGKRYVFDIQHTSREVHDQARRILHERGISTMTMTTTAAAASVGAEGGSATPPHSESTMLFEDISRRTSTTSTTSSAACSMASRLDMVLREKEEREAVIERCVETRIFEAMTCKICMDNAINTMFNPCCHVLACDQCAARCDKCPNCRVKITNVVKIFLPPELRNNNQQTTTNGCGEKMPSEESVNKVALSV